MGHSLILPSGGNASEAAPPTLWEAETPSSKGSLWFPTPLPLPFGLKVTQPSKPSWGRKIQGAKKKPPSLCSTALYCTTLEALGFDRKGDHCSVSPVPCSLGLQSQDLVGGPWHRRAGTARGCGNMVLSQFLLTPGWAQAKWDRGIGSWRSWGENPGHRHSVISTGIKLERLLQDQSWFITLQFCKGEGFVCYYLKEEKPRHWSDLHMSM